MKRNTNIELLRILCIIGITMHHLVYHSTIMDEAIGISRLFAQFFLLFGKSGVNIFVLISGYFLVKTDPFDFKGAVKRVFNLWKQLALYSIMLGGGVLPILWEGRQCNKNSEDTVSDYNRGLLVYDGIYRFDVIGAVLKFHRTEHDSWPV